VGLLLLKQSCDRQDPTGWLWKTTLWDRVGYPPSPEQATFHQSPAKLKLVTGGERAGKSYSAAMEAFSYSIATPMPTIGWVVGPQFKMCRSEMLYLKAAAEQLGIYSASSFPNSDNSEWKLWLTTGLYIHTLSGMDASKIAGEAPDWALLVEAGSCYKIVYDRVVGRLAPKDAPLLINGTLESTKAEGIWFTELAEEWAQPDQVGVAFRLPAWANRFYYPGGRQDPKILAAEARMGPNEFAERFGGEVKRPAQIVLHEFDFK